MSENSITLSVPGHSVTMSEGKFNSFAMHEDPQVLYDSIVGLRKSVSLGRKSRADALKNNARWATLKNESATISKEKKAIELSFDQEQPEFKAAIDHSDDMLYSLEAKLAAVALAAYKEGSPLQLVRTAKNGKQKKIEIRYKVHYHQLSLFT